MRFFFLSILLLHFLNSVAQDSLDVQHYRFTIEVSDANDSIHGTALIKVRAMKDLSSFDIDLAGGEPGKGMKVSSVAMPGKKKENLKNELSFFHYGDRLHIQLPAPIKKGDSCEIEIRYAGIPNGGLVISRNKYGERTFFSDNWPDRARQWIPCIDKPADKATVEFIVTAPIHYRVISNGVLVEDLKLSANSRRSHWREDVPLPTKIMVIGLAEFAVDTSGIVKGIPVTSWVFPQNKKDGFYDYAQAKDILSFFIDYVGPFPYKKLANVQSKTEFGGMENASAIFYHENSINGKREEEALLAHEIAHQWFGDMVTEKDYAHVWLSEGFATYLKHLYFESTYGNKRFVTELKKDRDKVIAFNKQTMLPIVDSVSTYIERLNANSYQKAGWFLHMLRRQVGDTAFRKIVRDFYAAYAGKNAVTKDFQDVCEKVSRQSLDSFFNQWLYQPGVPSIDVKWSYNAADKKLRVDVDQLQESVYEFPLEVGVKGSSGNSRVRKLEVREKKQSFEWVVDEVPVQLSLDPHTSLMFEGRVRKG